LVHDRGQHRGDEVSPIFAWIDEGLTSLNNLSHDGLVLVVKEYANLATGEYSHPESRLFVFDEDGHQRSS